MRKDDDLKVDNKEIVVEKCVFSKENLHASKLYRHQRDIISVILEDDVFYTLEDVNEKIKQFMKGKVK